MSAPARVLTRLQELAQAAESYPERLARAIVDAEQESLDDIEAEFRRRSEGTLTYSDLRRMGHPYARRDPQTPLDPAMLNTHSGELLAGYEQESIEADDEGTSGMVFNDSEHAHRIMSGGKGDSLMVERPIVEAVEDFIEAPRRERLQRAQQSVLSRMV
ncbi:hypothetical protein [Armatimonas rosea]|uniref:Uncharacterized protein n=1 Tax=Armatimonas rosea TaxID=685828 RepID=A0A7W9W8Z3_ARMRO|nr:hypothetical protein [Armatimonas rosea]MBB6053283.1 hypothetical protein [Armatimonas rosea]